MNWYYVEAGQQRGPVAEADLDNLFAAGKVQPDTLVWHEGMANWQPYRDVKPGGVPPMMNVPAAPAVAAPPFAPVEALEYGGFWMRFGAKIIDGFIVFIPIGMLITMMVTNSITRRYPGFASGGSAQMPPMDEILRVVSRFELAALLLIILYNTLFLGGLGATPGKMVFRLRVVTPDGAKIGWGRALGRSCAELLSGFLCYIGYIIAAFDHEKRALHDHIAGTRVIKRQ